MKLYHWISLLVLLSVTFSQAQHKGLPNEIAEKYCAELSKIDTASTENFEKILTRLDEKIIFRESGYLMSIIDYVNHSNISYADFYSKMYTEFSNQCPSYKALYGQDTTIQLKDPGYFTNSFCQCFTEETEGKIVNDDLTTVLKTCNEKLGNTKAYKRKLRKELKNEELTAEGFSKYITARFLTECNLIVDHLFNKQVKFLARSTELMLEEKEN